MEVFNNSAYGTINIDCNNKITVSTSNPQPYDTDGIRLVIVKISECTNLNELELFGGSIIEYDTLIYDDLILESITKTIQLPQDGNYFFRIRDYYSDFRTRDRYSDNEETFSFTTNNNLIKSILDRTQKIFCGCTSCNIINNIFKKTYVEELNLILDYILLFSLLEQCYNLTCLNCQFETINECDFINENFKGKEQYSEYKKNLILANVFNSLSLFLNKSNNTCFNTQINQIKKCIKKNNILLLDCVV